LRLNEDRPDSIRPGFSLPAHSRAARTLDEERAARPIASPPLIGWQLRRPF
jgi:hypothetical protein